MVARVRPHRMDLPASVTRIIRVIFVKSEDMLVIARKYSLFKILKK